MFTIVDEESGLVYEALKLCHCGGIMHWRDETDGMFCLHCDDVCLLKECDYCDKFARDFNAKL